MFKKRQKSPSRSLARRRSLSQQGILLTLRFSLGARPARKHESNLVDKVCNVVEHVEEDLINGSEQVAEEVTKRVDGPTRCDDHAHVLKGGRDGLAAASGGASSFTREDFVQNEEPAEHTTNEGRPCWEQEGLTEVAEQEHHDGAQQELPEHCAAHWLASSLEDQVELDHLQRDGNAPIDVPVDNGRLVNLHPILAHVHVVHACHQSDKTTHVQGRLPPC